MDNYNPVTAGLAKAMQMASFMQQHQAQQQQLVMAQRREERVQKLQTLSQQLDMQARGARMMTPADEIEAKTGQAFDMDAMQKGGFDAGIMPRMKSSDLKSRMVDLKQFGGDKWVLPSQTEVIQRQEAAKRRELDITDEYKARESGRTGANAKAVAEVNQAGGLARAMEQNKGTAANTAIVQGGLDARQIEDLRSREKISENTSKSAMARTLLTERGANGRNAARIAADTGGGKTGKFTPAQKQAARREIDEIEYGDGGSKKGIHRELEEIGLQLNSGKVVDDGKERGLTPQERTTLENKARILTTQRDIVLKRKVDLELTPEADIHNGKSAKNPMGLPGKKNDPGGLRL